MSGYLIGCGPLHLQGRLLGIYLFRLGWVGFYKAVDNGNLEIEELLKLCIFRFCMVFRFGRVGGRGVIFWTCIHKMICNSGSVRARIPFKGTSVVEACLLYRKHTNLLSHAVCQNLQG